MYIADLHIHSKYSRATSRDCDAPHLDLWARQKGIALIGTGDFTHPAWRAELAEALEPAEEGLYRLKAPLVLPHAIGGEHPTPRFVVSGEISTIYKRDGKTRKVHHVILLPSLEDAETLAHRLEAIGNLHSDGRPILGLDSRDLLEITLDTCPEAIFIPAHIWTPHFSVFGAFSDFETLEECYGDLTGHIHALETGLSSDPPMNRRLSMLDRYTLVSNSDAHSPSKLGREANLLTCALSYPALKKAIDTGEGFEGTIEFYPEEGKYHLDGHRNCHCCLEPAQTVALDGRCPVCGRKLTVGVLHRVEALADRSEPIALPKPYESLIPLPELLAACMGVSPASKRIQESYFDLLKRLGPEFHILRNMPVDEAERAAGFAFAEGLRRLRNGQVIRKAGYDGEYGVISLFQPGELEMLAGQTSLLGLAKPAAQRKGSASGVRKAGKKAQSADAALSAPIARLNSEQEEAVHSQAECTAVIAGPGTGKTKTLVSRILYLLEKLHIPASEITAVTFTRQAAKEMLERLIAQLGKSAVRGLTVGTFHAICQGLVEPKPLITPGQSLQIITTLLEEHGEHRSPAECRRLLSLFKNAVCQRTPATVGLPAWLPEAYAQRLAVLNLRDLDDLLLDALRVDVHAKRMFHHLLVDEFQDINAVQHALIAHWSEHGKTLFVIGDPDQAIYGFRGADAQCFDLLLSSRANAKRITLSKNYRSTPQILALANDVIARNPGPERSLVPTVDPGCAVRLLQAPDSFSEAIWISKEIARMAGGVDMLDAQAAGNDRAVTRSFSDIAVLCRTHRQLEQIETCLAHDSIPCVISGRDSFLEDDTVQGLLGFFASLLNPCAEPSLRMALSALWRVPDALCQRAAVALASSGEMEIDAGSLAQELEAFELLKPWLEAANALYPRIRRDKPRKLLEMLANLCGANGRPVEQLFNAAVFHNDIAGMLDDLLAGEESDIRRASGTGYQSGAVRLMTLHSAKGLEFPVVFLAGVTAGSLPLEHAGESANLAEERRLFFVGITRAREELILSCGGAPSPFLNDLPRDVARIQTRARNRIPRTEQISFF
ncbi:MAG: UvrD-helicase domain-containing protein [Clostridiales bacterium]|nr:UvrD-helicase domain-containing protein [Clostridiales bacterium]